MNKNLINNETGRSMVEMLGVLAVIGVLSVGSIAGYKNAMIKHNANELLNEASKRAVVAAAQIAAGHTPTLSEFTDNTVGDATLGNVSYTSGEKTFSIAVSGLSADSPVCEKIHATVGENTNVNIDENCSTFIYNTDLSIGVTLVPAGKPCTGEQAEGTTCENGLYLCPNGQQACNGSCCPEGKWCIPTGETTYTCTDATSGTCSTYKECQAGGDKTKYCKVTATYDSTATSTGCSKDFGGTCETITRDTTFGTNGILTIDGVNYIRGNDPMTWYAANDWCLAQGMTLVSLDDIGCAYGSICTSPVIGKSFWTASQTKFDSCNAYRVIKDGTVDEDADRTYKNNLRPVCRD